MCEALLLRHDWKLNVHHTVAMLDKGTDRNNPATSPSRRPVASFFTPPRFSSPSTFARQRDRAKRLAQLQEEQDRDLRLLRRQILMMSNSSRLRRNGVSSVVEESSVQTGVESVSSDKSYSSGSSVVSFTARFLCLHLPLALLFAVLMAVYILRTVVYDEFYQPLFNRSRRTDLQLLDEFTYYERQCNRYDVSTQNLQDLVVKEPSNSTDEAVDKMMRHGTVVLSNILDNATTEALRNHIVYRNNHLSELEAFPVSQGEQGLRVSYGIDASESPAVAAAVKAVAKRLGPLLQQLTGDVDPASAEITAITVRPGADHQGWHPDTKGDGNALKFARSYSHSYSLFVPLQDTTGPMGATDICPGTHYCGNDMTEICQGAKLGLHLADPERWVIPAGDGALLNQHMWHRGTEHRDHNADERVMFIMSFLARPPSGPDRGDARQLSRGTYFHQRWNMWGHTMSDLDSALERMGKPFSWLRAMGLWKPASAGWGYDLVTSAFMRFSNGQLEDDEIFRLLGRLDELNFPRFLRGDVIDPGRAPQKQIWEVFVSDTIDNVLEFVWRVNLLSHTVYLALICIVAVNRRRFVKTLSSSASRLCWSHGFVLVMCWAFVTSLRSSQWGANVQSGRTLMRPFPPVQLSRTDDGAPRGLTTMPTRLDVLIGSRFDAPFLGSYDRWLDYHPGNLLFRDVAKQHSRSYLKSHLTSPVVAAQCKHNVVEAIRETGGRFLQQDYRTGEWVILSLPQAQDIASEEMLSLGNPLLGRLRKRLSWLIAETRFGLRRSTVMSRLSQVSLMKIRKELLPPSVTIPPAEFLKPEATTSALAARRSIRVIRPTPKVATFQRPLFLSSIKHKYDVGSLVWCSYEQGESYPGSIIAVQKDGRFVVSFDDGFVESDVAPKRLSPITSVTEGDRATGCFRPNLQDCFQGTIGRVHPSGLAMIKFDDGDTEFRMEPHNYYVEPFKYAWEVY